MMDLFYMGGPLFMGILTLLLLVVLVIAVWCVIVKEPGNAPIGYIRHVGLFALVTGILAQLIGLYAAFDAIQQMGEGISAALLAGGLKVSMITTMYGLFIYLISLLIWMGLKLRLKKA